MAESGTITETISVYGTLLVTIAGIESDTNSPAFTLKGYPFTSAVVSGDFGGSAPTCQWQGSNDGGVTWVDIGSSFTSGPANGTLTPFLDPYGLYQLDVVGGDGDTSINVSVNAYGSRG